MPISSIMGPSQTNINSSNIQLYGGRKVFVNAGRTPMHADMQGMIAANREYNTYLTGLAKLTGAGAQMLDKFWSAMLETEARDTETALSKAYRDMFTELSLDEKYQGAGAMGLSNAFMDRKKDVYERFREDNPNLNKRILNNIDAQLQNRYYDRIGALQTDRLAQWHTQSKINNMAETVDTASLSQLGDFNALQDVFNKSKELFGNDPVRGRTLANDGLKTVLQAWAGQSPSGFMAWSKGNKDKVLSMFGGSNAKDIDAIFNHAQAQVRADQHFAMAVENHNRQMMLFQRKEESLRAANNLTEIALTAAKEGKPLELNPDFLLSPNAQMGGKRPIDVMQPSELAGLANSFKTLGMPLEFNPANRQQRFYLLADTNNPHIPMKDYKQSVFEAYREGVIQDANEVQRLIDKHSNIVNSQEKANYETGISDIKRRAVATGDVNLLQEMTDYMSSPYFQNADFNFVHEAVKAGNTMREILGSDMFQNTFHFAQNTLSPKNDMGIPDPAQDQYLNNFMRDAYRLADDLKRNTKLTIAEKQAELDFGNKDGQLYKLLKRYADGKEDFINSNSAIQGSSSFTPTKNASVVPSVPLYSAYQGQARGRAPRIKPAEGSPTGDKQAILTGIYNRQRAQ